MKKRTCEHLNRKLQITGSTGSTHPHFAEIPVVVISLVLIGQFTTQYDTIFPALSNTIIIDRLIKKHLCSSKNGLIIATMSFNHKMAAHEKSEFKSSKGLSG